MGSKKSGRGGYRPGAGRPAKHAEGTAAPITVTVPVVLADRLRAIAELREQSASELMTAALRAWLSAQ